MKRGLNNLPKNLKNEKASQGMVGFLAILVLVGIIIYGSSEFDLLSEYLIHRIASHFISASFPELLIK